MLSPFWGTPHFFLKCPYKIYWDSESSTKVLVCVWYIPWAPFPKSQQSINPCFVHNYVKRLGDPWGWSKAWTMHCGLWCTLSRNDLKGTVFLCSFLFLFPPVEKETVSCTCTCTCSWFRTATSAYVKYTKDAYNSCVNYHCVVAQYNLIIIVLYYNNIVPILHT